MQHIPASPHEAPTIRRFLTLVGRGLRLRCPNCGVGGIFESFGRMRPSCQSCGLPLERTEGDYFIGAYMLNLVFVEMIIAAVIVVVLLRTWPDPPWEAIEIGCVVATIVGAVACYRFSKTLWLAVDLFVRPASATHLVGGDEAAARRVAERDAGRDKR